MMRQTSLGAFTILALAVALLLGTTPATAQTQATGGNIEGTALDADGAPLPGASVTITNQDTGRERTTTTGPSGYFRVPLLPPGTYTITVELQGFQPVERQGVTLELGALVTLDFELQLAAVEETLVVTGEAPIVETSKTEVSSVINENAIDSLPILGRDFTDFTLLTPGTLIEGSRGTVAITGQRGVNTSVNIDGASSNSAFFGYQRGGTDAPFTVSQESVREFQVVTSGIMPEFGRSGGGLVNVVTKSGTNQWRGGGHFFIRDESLVADDPFDREQSEFSVQQFGGSVGGPVQRNESFIFGSADFQRFDTPFFVDFNLPQSDVAAINDVVSAARPDLVLEEGTFTKTNDAQVYFAKFDQSLGDNHTLTLRYNFSFHETLNGGSFDPSGTTDFAETAQATQDELTNSLVVQLTSILGDRAYNEFRFQFSNDDLDRSGNDPDGPLTTIFVPEFVGFGRPWFMPINVREDKYQFQNNFSYLFDTHDVKAGFDVETDNTDEVFANFNGGWYQFLFLDNFLDSVPLRLIQGFGGTDFEARQTMAAAYVQDSWKVTPDVTLNYGVRWEGTFNPTPPGNAEFPETQRIPDDTDNWQPRFGLAWSPDDKSVARLSAGYFYSRTPTLLFFNAFNNIGLPGEGVFESPSFASNLIGQWPDVLPSADQFPDAVQRVFWFNPDFQEAETLRVNAGYEREIVEDFSVGASFVYARGDRLQRLFDTNLARGFVNGFGRLIYENDGSDPVRPVPGLENGINFADGFSRYKALIIDFEKRMSQGYGFFGSYTLAEDEDNDSNERSADGRQPTNIFDPDADFSYSDRDVRHRFVVSGFADLPYGFKLSGIATLRSGRPFTAFLDGEDANFDGVDDNDRAVIDGQVSERNSFRDPNFYNVDVRVTKAFQLGQVGEFEFLFEVFNLLDNENLVTTNTNFLSSSFAELDSFIGTPRQIQFGFRFNY